MKQSSILALLTLWSMVTTAECDGVDSNDTEINWISGPVFTDCGGVIPLFSDGWRSASIKYKESTTYSPNEFCVWTVLADDSIGSIALQFFQNFTKSQENKDGIVVYTWKDSNFTSHKIPHSTGNTTFVVAAQTFAIAFSSQYSSGQSYGFRLDFNIQKYSFDATKPRAYFSGLTMGEFTYPKVTGQEKYGNYENVSVVLHRPTETPRKSVEYELRDLDIERSHDFLDVYILLPYWDELIAIGHYKFIGRFSGQHVGLVENSKVLTPFPMLFLFSSDRKGTGKGFTIKWVDSRNEIGNIHALCN